MAFSTLGLSCPAACLWRPLNPPSFHPHSLRVAVLLALLLLLNAIDLRYTLLAHRVGLLGELNPIAANLLHLGLEPSLICYKALTLLIGCSLLWRVRRSSWTLPACWLLIAVYFGLTIMWYFWTQDYLQILAARASLPQLLPTDL